MTGSELRQRFLQHFTSRDHLEQPSASLIPVRDPTTLFNSAGMQPLKPYFQGVSQPPAPRLVSSQKCFRTQDLDEVGKTDRHGTFFEMLGNFAPTGSYFKETAIELAWDLVTVGLQMPKDRLRVTVHPTDDEADSHWRTKTDVRPEWIYRHPDNWWAAGDTGPCGPDSEIWWDRGVEYGCGQADCEPDHCDRFLEFWNLVFMQFDRRPDGSLKPLPRPGIDTGMGLERLSAIKQGVDSIFEIDLYRPLMDFVAENSKEPVERSRRLITDHLRGMTFVIGDGVLPSNEGRGYVLRRLVRAAALHARKIGLGKPLSAGVDVVVGIMKDRYPELVERAPHIREAVDGEAQRFNRTLEQGLELFERVVAKHPRLIPGEEAFRLHDTYGFPIELTRDLAEERGIEVDQQGFQEQMAAQRERSRSMTGQRWPNASALPRSQFEGYHQPVVEGARVLALRRAGDDVAQVAEGDQVEVFLDATPFYAESGGQIGDTVRVVCFGDWTCELCGGTHVASSADVGATVILSQSSVAAGVRRIDLVAGEAADELVRRRLSQQNELARGLGVSPDQLPRRVAELRAELREKDRAIAGLREELRSARVRGPEGGPRKVEARVPLLMETVAADGMDDLRGYADRYLEALGGSGVVAVVGGDSFVIKVSRDLDINAKELTEHFGRGGGTPALAQGRMTKPLADAFKELAEALR